MFVSWVYAVQSEDQTRIFSDFQSELSYPRAQSLSGSGTVALLGCDLKPVIEQTYLIIFLVRAFTDTSSQNKFYFSSFRPGLLHPKRFKNGR